MSASRRKGTAFESLVVAFLRPYFPAVERRALTGSRDRGDVAGMPGTVIECKDEARIQLAAYCDEARTEAANADADEWFVVVKRRRAGVDRAYVVQELGQWVRGRAA